MAHIGKKPAFCIACFFCDLLLLSVLSNICKENKSYTKPCQHKTRDPVKDHCLFRTVSRNIFGMKIVPLAVSMVLGVLVCYAFGTAWFSVISEITFGKALAVCVLPYIPFDALKIAAAVFIARRTYKFIDL